MANWTGETIPDLQVPSKQGMVTAVFQRVTPSKLGASTGTISIADTIELFELAKNVRITRASIRTSGDMSASGAPTLQLTMSNSSVINLTDAVVANAAGNKTMSIAPPFADAASTTIIRAVVAGGTIDRTLSSQTFEVSVDYYLEN